MRHENLPLRLNFYESVLSIRPAQLAALIKRVLFIHRVVVETSDGLKFWIDPVSILGLKLLRDRTFEPSLSKLIKRLLRVGDTFVDVGANEGYFSVLAANATIPGGRVVAVEPQQRLLPVIERNLELNQLSNVEIMSDALSDKKGTA